jgi:hypothetical protein
MLKLNMSEVFPIIEIASEYKKLYSLISINEFNNFIRMFSDGSGKLNFIVNNFDMRMHFNILIEKDIQFDKVYFIDELSKIFKGMNVYNEVFFNPEINLLKFNDDAEFFINEKLIKDEEKIYSNDEIKISESKTNELNTFIKSELNKIKSILSLKNTKFPNYYSYLNGSDMIFNFFNIYLKKINNIHLINTDILGLQFLVYIFSKYENIEFNYGINDNKYIFKSENFYIEGRNIKIEDEKIKTIDSFFTSFNKISEINLKLEFHNFISTVVSSDKTIFLVFDDNKVKLQSSADKEDEDFLAEFKTLNDFKGFFLFRGEILRKALSFALKYTDKIDQFNLILGESVGNNKWMRIEAGDTEILIEITADIDSEDPEEIEDTNSIFED